MIQTRGVNGKLKVSFDDMGIFGTPENTRVIYMKMKE
jgi:2'-5' RNA ligase